MEIQETKQSPFNTTPRRSACSASQSSANYNAVALQFPQFAQLSAVQQVQISMEKFPGIYVAISSLLSVQSPTPLSKP